MDTSKSEDEGAVGQAQSTAEGHDLYAVLNLKKNASAKEVRDAYFRLKNTYSSNNQALYSLIDESEINESVGLITQAYEVLHRTNTRQAYDQELLAAGLTKVAELCPDLYQNASATPKPSQTQRGYAAKIALANDQAEEQRRERNEGNLELVEGEKQSTPNSAFASVNLAPRQGDAESVAKAFEGVTFFGAPGGFQRGVILERQTARKMVAGKALNSEIQEHIKRLISDHDLGDGSLYRRIRQTVGVSQEEMQDHIKITVGYIQHLEENRFDLLPQPVYVRGFLKSYLRFLGVSNCDRLVNAYVERFNDWIASKNP